MGSGDGQLVYAEFSADQGTSIRVVPRMVAVPSTIAVGMLAVCGAITGAFTVSMPDADRANAGDHGDVPSASVPSLPLLTAMATPSPAAAPRASRGSREPLVVADSAAWPISDQRVTSDDSGNGAAGEPARAITTTTAHDRGPELRAFTPPTPPDPSSGHGGGGAGQASAPQAPPAGGSTLFGLLRPIGQLVGLTAERGEDNVNGAADGVGVPSPGGVTPTGGGNVDREPKSPNVIRNDSALSAGSHTSRGNRAERRREARSADDGGVSGGSNVARKSNDTRGAGNGGRDGQSGGDGHDRRSGGDR
jgi:hypothetical protein